jgi:hypothetical protein
MTTAEIIIETRTRTTEAGASVAAIWRDIRGASAPMTHGGAQQHGTKEASLDALDGTDGPVDNC